MDKVINLEELATKPIVIERTEDFYKSTNAVSEYLRILPLSTEQNNKLLNLMVEHTKAAERSGFVYGLKLAVAIFETVKVEKEGKPL